MHIIKVTFIFTIYWFDTVDVVWSYSVLLYLDVNITCKEQSKLADCLQHNQISGMIYNNV